jgi:pyruvate/2-oxoglutarate/acetoin dehydrogenase E1 component
LRKGSDITVVVTSWMNVESLRAADVLQIKHGVSLEIVDPRTILPLDDKILENSNYPDSVTIIRKVEAMLDLPHADISDQEFFSYEKKFKGPY